jgi:ribosomal protein S18 acetylase RimI-like enzyme
MNLEEWEQMLAASPFVTPRHDAILCELSVLQGTKDAQFLSTLLASMDPWHTLRYTASALLRYFVRPDPGLYRYAIGIQGKTIGVVCIRYPWLRGAYIEFIGVEGSFQSLGIGREILSWIEEQTRLEASNVWVLVSSFNQKAREFYTRQGYAEVGILKDFMHPGYDEVFLRKMLF